MADYVDNKKFLEAIKEYKQMCREAEQKKEPVPQITDYIGECIMLIADGLGKRPNFMNYVYKDDMICEGIRDCIKAVDNFNPEFGSNPFAYFTQICWYAFIRIIEKEKKQDKIKYSLIKDANVDGDYTNWLKMNGRLDEHADATDLAKHYNLTDEDLAEIEEAKKKKKRKPRKKKDDTKRSLIQDDVVKE